VLLTTDQKGAIAELAIAKAAIALGAGVYRPLTEGGRYDLIFDLGSRLVRVQCKWACRRGEIVSVRCYSARRTAAGLVQQSYTADEVDAVAAYCLELDRCFFLPTERFPGRTTVQLRLSAARNNQQAGVNWADEFDFSATLRPIVGP
jgi:PD-(D/E)XK endonuclease